MENKGAQTLLKAISKTIKEGATLKGDIKSILKPTVAAVLGATVDQVVSKLIQMHDNHDSASSPNLPITVQNIVWGGSDNKRRHDFVYKKHLKRIKYWSIKRQIIYHF